MNDLNKFCKDYGWCFLSADHYPSISDNKSLVVFLLPKWSQSDLQIVASIAQKIIEKRIRVEVFDIDEIKTQDKLKEMFPGLLNVTQTPVLIEYSQGEICFSAQGKSVSDY